MRRLVVILAVIAAAATVAAPAASQAPPDQPAHRRIERSLVLDEPWRSTVGGGLQIFSVSTGLPGGAAEYDIVVSATLELRTTSTDHADISASYHVESGAPHPPALFAPQDFRLMSAAPGRTSTTTATWSGTLPHTDDPVTFAIQARAVDGPDEGTGARASGKKLTVVVDILPSDD